MLWRQGVNAAASWWAVFGGGVVLRALQGLGGGENNSSANSEALGFSCDKSRAHSLSLQEILPVAGQGYRHVLASSL